MGLYREKKENAIYDQMFFFMWTIEFIICV